MTDAVAPPAGRVRGRRARAAPGASSEHDPHAVLEAVDDALAEMQDFLQVWSRALVCRRPPDKRILANDSHLQSRFGRWFAENATRALVRQSAFEELGRLHRQIHDRARVLAAAAAEGGAVPVGEYDALMSTVGRFRNQARRIRDAFRKALSEIDPLTGLHNRLVMAAELEVEFERAGRTGSPLCIALTDIDRFKQVNDAYGHAVGDLVLSVVAGRFLSHLRPYDTIYRYGGEEFLICLPNSNAATANGVLERLRMALDDDPVPLKGGDTLPVTASFGVVEVDTTIPLKQSIERADDALYAAKEGGRNTVVTWSGRLGKAGAEDG